MSHSPLTTTRPPAYTPSGREILSFHLHRFLAAWMAQAHVEQVYIALGFPGSTMPDALIEVTAGAAKFVDLAWGFKDVEAAVASDCRWLNNDALEKSLAIVPLTEVGQGGEVTIGFALVASALDSSQLDELRTHARSAIQASHRNAIRIFFDETPNHDIKRFLYLMMEHLPEWSGCDGSAAVILSDSLDAMRLLTRESNFVVMAERLYTESDDRLVGMGLTAEPGTLLGEALEGQRAGTKRIFHRYVMNGAGKWESGEAEHESFHAAGRDEAMMVLVPLVSQEGDEREHLGWLSLCWKKPVRLASSTLECFAVLADRLASGLRHSPLYTLSARKMWILRSVRNACERAISGAGSPAQRRSGLVHEVVDLVQSNTGVPSFGLGHVIRRGAAQKRSLKFETSYGWSAFSEIEMPIDVDAAATDDSGVSTLAVRLNQTMVLAGRSAEKGFKNYLWVDESAKRIADSRTPEGSQALEDGAHWRRLSAYYKPARDQAYGTLAHPVSFAGEVLGVIALEVDRNTPWYWWSGYGGQLFWELMAGDIAFAFRAIAVDEEGTKS